MADPAHAAERYLPHRHPEAHRVLGPPVHFHGLLAGLYRHDQVGTVASNRDGLPPDPDGGHVGAGLKSEPEIAAEAALEFDRELRVSLPAAETRAVAHALDRHRLAGHGDGRWTHHRYCRCQSGLSECKEIHKEGKNLVCNRMDWFCIGRPHPNCRVCTIK